MTLQRSEEDFGKWWLESQRRFQEVADRAFDQMIASRRSRPSRLEAMVPKSPSVAAYLKDNLFLSYMGDRA